MPAVLFALTALGLGIIGIGSGGLILTHLIRADDKAQEEQARKRLVLLAKRRGQIARFVMSDGKTITGAIVDTDAEVLLVILDPQRTKKGRRKDLIEVSLLEAASVSVEDSDID